MRTSSLDPHIGVWIALLLCLNGAACIRKLDVSKIQCTQSDNCPVDYVCSGGRCLRGDSGISSVISSDGATDRTGGADRATTTVSDDASAPRPNDANLGIGGAAGDAIGSGGAGGASTEEKGAGGAGREESGGAGTSTESGSGGSGGLGGGLSAAGGVVSDAPIVPRGPDAKVAMPSGSACTDHAQCTSDLCIDGVCCATTCTGCNACANALTGKADGTCAAVANGQDPHNACDDETASKECGNDGLCDGTGACRQVGSNHVCKQASCSADGKTFTPAAICDGKGACTSPTPQSCGAFTCADTGCLRNCTATTDCGGGNYCNASTKTCAATKANGQPATLPEECTSGVVADGVCCDKACAGCSACTLALNGRASPSSDGACLPVVAGKVGHGTCTASPPCGQDGSCDGNGGCRFTSDKSACGASSCTGSSLSTKACDATTHSCVSTDSACPNSAVCADSSSCGSKKVIGSSCGAGTDCDSGVCADGVCCNTTCSGQCESCASAASRGTCVAVTTPRTPCAGSGTPCGGSCNGTQRASCVYPGTSASCGLAARCTGDTATLATTCAGDGTCSPASTVPCNGYGCNGTVCATSCPAGQSYCSGSCVDVQSSYNHCGSCTTICSGGTPWCLAGGCVQCRNNTDCPGGATCGAGSVCTCQQPSSSNLLTNPGFDSQSAMTASWSPTSSASWTADDADGCQGSGAAKVVATPLGIYNTIGQCVRISSMPYFFSLKSKREANSTWGCEVTAYTGTDCTGDYVNGLGIGYTTVTSPAASWSRTGSVTFTPGSGAHSIMVGCNADSGTVYFDQLYLNATLDSY